MSTEVAITITFPWQDHPVGTRLTVDERVARRLIRSGVARKSRASRKTAQDSPAEVPLAPSDMEAGESPTQARKRLRKT